MKHKPMFIIGIFVVLIAGCSTTQPGSQAQASLSILEATPTLSTTSEPDESPAPDGSTAIPTPESTATRFSHTSTSVAIDTPEKPLPEAPPETPRRTLEPDEWQSQPVIPTVSDTVVEIYKHGQTLGNDSQAFSKIGDCGSTPAWFLGDFDRGPKFYELGDYQELEEVIQAFQGSFGRTSLAARSGFNVSSLFVTLWADRSQCETNETPLACEYRVHQPGFAFITLGANDIWNPDRFEPQMRKIIEYSIENGVIPILSTKADNEEGDGSINATIARLAYEYDIPLWNYWLAVQPLPDHGLQEDLVHLTWGRNFFDDPEALEKAWPIRNLTALQVLDAVWRKASGRVH